jgi:hypothetical protein
MAALVALGVAACGDDVEIVQPSPEPPPPPPAVTASMAPASASVLIGNSVVFAVNASGGVAGDAASWTCASSNSGIATVSVVGAGCQATGVAVGSVTVTATVTKSGETVNVGAQLTVTEEATGDPAFIIMTLGTGLDADDLSGRVSVSLGVERGDQTLERLSLLVDGEEVAYQSFGSPAMAAAEDDAAAEQAVHQFTLGFDSDGYDAETGAPEYMNGEHTLSAELRITGGMMADGMMGHEIVSSNAMTVQFDNPDGVIVTADLGHNSALDDNGARWYGGPANGHIVISALAVSYSGAETGAVTIGLGDEASGDDCEAEADDSGHGGAGVSFEFDCEGEAADRSITVLVGGEDANILNEDDLPTANIDMEGPATAPYFDPNPNNRQEGWVNLTVDFLGEQGTGSRVNGWLIYNEDEDGEPGVGGYQPVLRYADEDGSSVEDAIAATPLSLTNLPGESEEDAYCAVVSAVDVLGNESSLPDEDDGMCLTAGVPSMIADDGSVIPATDGSYEALLEALRAANALDDDTPPATAKAEAIADAEEALADAGLLAGVDITPPRIEIDEDERINAVAGLSLAFDVYDDEHDDHNSGLHTVAPLLVRIQRRDASGTECLAITDAATAAAGTGTAGEVDNGDDVSCTADPSALAAGTAVTFGTTPATSHAYYTLSGAALDQAGNVSMIESHTFVYDLDEATSNAMATVPAAPGSIDAGDVFQIASFLNDDLSIRDYYVTANFAGDIELGIVSPTVVDAFDADPLTHRNHTVAVDVETYAGITTAPIHSSPATPTAATGVTGVTVAVRDQAQSGATPYTEVSTTGTTLVDAPAAGDNFTVSFSAALEDIDAVCVAEDEDDCEGDNRESETELEFEARAGATGAFSNPFDRVDFWIQDVNGASWLIGSDASGESGRVGGATNDRTRTWTYSLEVSADVLYMLTREEEFPRDEIDGATADESTVRAFGVNDDGVALVGSGTVTIDDGDDGT